MTRTYNGLERCKSITITSTLKALQIQLFFWIVCPINTSPTWVHFFDQFLVICAIITFCEITYYSVALCCVVEFSVMGLCYIIPIILNINCTKIIVKIFINGLISCHQSSSKNHLRLGNYVQVCTFVCWG